MVWCVHNYVDLSLFHSCTSLRTDRCGASASPAIGADILEAKTPTNNEEELTDSVNHEIDTPTADKVLSKQRKREQIMKAFGKYGNKRGNKTLGSPKRLLEKRCVKLSCGYCTFYVHWC